LYYDQLLAKAYPPACSAHPAPEILAHNQPSHTERNLRSMIAIAWSSGDPVLISYHAPLTVKTNGGLWARHPEYNDLIRRLAAEENAPFFDLAPQIPAERTYWTPDGVHLSAEGARLQARLLADFLLALPRDRFPHKT
jgi:lysophospholipase L1-like esterase